MTTMRQTGRKRKFWREGRIRKNCSSKRSHVDMLWISVCLFFAFGTVNQSISQSVSFTVSAASSHAHRGATTQTPIQHPQLAHLPRYCPDSVCLARGRLQSWFLHTM